MIKCLFLYLTKAVLLLYGFSQHVSSQTFNDTLQAKRDYNIAQQYLKALKYDSALIFLQQSYTIYKANRQWENVAEIASITIETYRIIAKYDSALINGYEPLELLEKNLGSDNILYAKVLGAIAINLWSKGDLDSSLAANRTVLRIRLEKLGEYHFDVASTYNTMGIVYTNKSNFDSALIYLKKALDIRIATFGPMHNSVASSYINLGAIYRQLGDYIAAEENYIKALSIRVKVLGEDHPRTALIYSNLAICYDVMGDIEKSTDYHTKAISINIRTFGINHPDIADSYIDLSILNYNCQDFKTALFYERKALMIRQYVFGFNSPNTAVCLGNIGNIFRELGQLDSAYYYYDSAYSINKRNFQIHGEIAKNLAYLANIYGKKKQFRVADSLFTAAIQMASKVFGEKNPEKAAMWLQRAELAEQNDNLDKALQYTQYALISQLPAYFDSSILANPSLELMRPETATIEILAQKAHLYKKQFERTNAFLYLEESYKVYELTVSWIDLLRRGYRLEGSKLFWGTKAKLIYESALRTITDAYRLTLDNKWIDRAFDMSQRSKSGVLREALHDLQVRSFVSIPDSISLLERALRTRIAFYETQYISTPQTAGTNTSDEKLQTARLLFDLKSQYESLLQWIEKNNPSYYHLKYNISTPIISDIQNQLETDSSIVLDFFVGDSLFIITRLTAKNKSIHVQHKDSTLDYAINQIRKGLTNLDISLYEKYASLFYQRWLKTFLQSITAGTPLIIIPDGMLYYLPFETLITSTVESNSNAKYTTKQYLSQLHPVRYLLSADMLFPPKRKPPFNSFYGVAPVFDDGVLNGEINSLKFSDSTRTSSRLVKTSGEHFPILPYSIQEVKQIQSIFTQKKWDSKIIVHHAATKKQISNDTLTNYGYIHIASHGFINEVNPKLSGIALFSDDSGPTKETMLYAGDIYNLKLNANLVTLSACKSALGKIEKGEGVIGLTRGFIYAGARHVLVSLWPVDDQMTAEFMEEFYRNVFTEKNLSLALQKTQKKWISQKQTSYPGDWGAFVLIGY